MYIFTDAVCMYIAIIQLVPTNFAIIKMIAESRATVKIKMDSYEVAGYTMLMYILCLMDI